MRYADHRGQKESDGEMDKPFYKIIATLKFINDSFLLWETL